MVSGVWIFQSTLPRGSDDYFGLPTGIDNLISIHAPSRERLTQLGGMPLVPPFQSTLPRGSDIFDYGDKFIDVCFQSTLPRGSDRAAGYLLANLGFSIHAPSQERPYIYSSDPIFAKFSIHAPSRERQRARAWLRMCSLFNPRSLAGATSVWQF